MTSSELTAQLLSSPNCVVAMGYHTCNENQELRRVELAARTCYKSEDKITETSHIELFKMLVRKKHFAMLRFGEKTVKLSVGAWDEIKQILISTRMLQYWRWQSEFGGVIVTTNFNSWILLYTIGDNNIKNIVLNVFKLYPVMTEVLLTIEKYNAYNIEDIVVDVTTIPFPLRRYSFRVLTDRGITHEIVRHTTLSYAQESTRYVNYKSKETMAFIPKHIEEQNLSHIFLKAFDDSIVYYQNLVDDNILKPQDARGILPNCLKTEICMSGYYDTHELLDFQQGFSHFIKMRAALDAHPGIRPIALEIQKYFDLQKED